MNYQPIIGTLGYIDDGERILMVHRNKRSSDTQLGKYNGLGGKMHANEDIITCMKREIYEESGIVCHKLQLRGTINWTGFGKKKENWLGIIFLINEFSGTAYQENPEGELVWIEKTQLNKLPLWAGDHHFLPLVFDNDPRTFHGYMPYDNEKLLSWQYTRI